MKRLLPSFLLAFLVIYQFPLLAQPTLTAVTNNLQVGDQFFVRETTVGAPQFTTAAATGANQTWNFGTLPAGAGQLAVVLARSAAPKPTSFPAANMVVQVGNQYSFIENNGIVLKEHGAFESMQNYFLENTDPAEKLKFPLTYNDTFTDAFAGNADLAGTVVPRNGNVTVKAEGYGTLITPFNTYLNVLKVKTEEIANPMTLFSENTVTYDWYEVGTHFPILRMTRRITLLSTDYSAFYMGIIIGTKKEVPAGFTVQLSPNPASEKVLLQLENTGSAPVKLTVTSLTGQQLANVELENTGGTKISQLLDVSGYAKGIYLLRLQTEGKLVVKRLVVQ